jgi:type IV pilus assembly protein PilP
MPPYPAKRLAIWSLCLLIPLVGCDSGGRAPEKPAVVSKKVVTPETAAEKPAGKVPVVASTALPSSPVPAPSAAAKLGVPSTMPMSPVEAPGTTKAGSGLLPFAGKDFGVAYGYSPEGKIDPFQPLLQDKPPAEPSGKQVASKPCPPPRTPLERIDLGQIKLVAVLRLPTGNRALVEETTGKGYIISIGTHIGPNCGVVKDILSDRLVIDEAEKDLTEKSYTTRTKELVLLKPLGE